MSHCGDQERAAAFLERALASTLIMPGHGRVLAGSESTGVKSIARRGGSSGR